MRGFEFGNRHLCASWRLCAKQVIEKVIAQRRYEAQRRKSFTRSTSLDHIPILLWFPSTAASLTNPFLNITVCAPGTLTCW